MHANAVCMSSEKMPCRALDDLRVVLKPCASSHGCLGTKKWRPELRLERVQQDMSDRDKFRAFVCFVTVEFNAERLYGASQASGTLHPVLAGAVQATTCRDQQELLGRRPAILDRQTLCQSLSACSAPQIGASSKDRSLYEF